MPESFGARLRRRREEQAIALVTIAQQTKIKQSLLEELERDDISHWPSGIFRRAFLRAYALAIGLDPDATLREFLAIHPEPAQLVEPAWAISPEPNGPATSAGPPTRLRYLVGSAIDSLARRRRGPSPDDTPTSAGPLNLSHHPEPVVPPTTDSPVAPEARDIVPVDPPVFEHVATDPDLMEVARLCTELSRVETAPEIKLLLRDVAAVLDAVGVIVWVWDEQAAALRPALVHGYSDRVRAQLPMVRRDADNATAAAFRSAQACVISGGDETSGALVVPLLTHAGCTGVLAIELQHGGEQTTPIRAAATIFAALLARLTTGSPAPARAEVSHVADSA